MKLLKLILTALILPMLSGCLGSFSPSKHPEYFEVDYPYERLDCGESFKKGVKIWPLSASAPYDREQMIILDPSRQVRFSSQYRWVTLPGDMVADKLLRDLAQDPLFEKAVPSGNPFKVSTELGGHLFRFALEEINHSTRAVLDVEIALWNEEPKRHILFRKHYHFESGPSGKGTPEGFAEAMSGLVRELSKQLRQDLCTIRKDSSPPDGG